VGGYLLELSELGLGLSSMSTDESPMAHVLRGRAATCGLDIRSDGSAVAPNTGAQWNERLVTTHAGNTHHAPAPRGSIGPEEPLSSRKSKVDQRSNISG
jgi:hypothetical protein